MGEISVKTGNNARNGGKNSLNRLIRCVCGKKIGPDPRNFNQRVSLGRNDLLIRTFPNEAGKVIYKTITRDVVKYVQSPNRIVCRFDDDAVQLRQRAIDAANSIPGFDEPAVQSK
ncbi:hypothetical protein [Klebsiella pneumoniae]|uniref:hypothetical protein n=1 Tax=Klebsiella pneumoniae TaxID=573 RepID=UPI001082491F|nr:hypothetical protein [Klebsiella pneumoniae]